MISLFILNRPKIFVSESDKQLSISDVIFKGSILYMFNQAISRRRFVKDLALAGGTLAMGTSSAANAGQKRRGRLHLAVTNIPGPSSMREIIAILTRSWTRG